ncbi:MAG: SUMF1/EgtB/PvdO family nonheme iron enzyme [Anaerolineaceae bacterium]|nr:SUMF1/EgtB/PvdO family nonheme iron enzyme [Anaerolineaceae bacterium]
MTDKQPNYNFHEPVQIAEFIGRDQHITGFTAQQVEQIIEKVLVFFREGANFLPVAGQGEAFAIECNGEKLVFKPGAAHQLAFLRNTRAYLLSLTINREYRRWATCFVSLAGKMDVRQVTEGLPMVYTEWIIPTGGEGLQAQPEQKRLTDIAEAMHSHPAFVILGEPGSGKTTTQQKVAFDEARRVLEGEQRRIPLFVRLSQQGAQDPYAFLQTEWERRTDISFAEALAAGQILILADGINEIPREQMNERLKAWRIFELEHRGANQLIFSGRRMDYDNQLNLPRVLVEPLDDERITTFLQRHHAEGMQELLDDPRSRLREMAGNPLNLFVLTMVFHKAGKNLQLLSNRGRLFEAFTFYLLNNEQNWHPDRLSVDAKVSLLSGLAFAMQQQGQGTTFALADANRALPDNVLVMGEAVPVERMKFFRFGRGADVLDPAVRPDVHFYHHLLQEYFAARELLRRFNSGEDLSALWQAPRFVDEDGMEEAGLGEWDPLPEPPTSGWEVTIILAAGLSRSPEKLIDAVRGVNPILAGRCLDEAGLAVTTSGEENNPLKAVREDIRADLLADLYDPHCHLRARLLSGTVLGRIGDPRFKPETINGVQVILPTLVDVPGGEYRIGSPQGEAEAYDDEHPPTPVTLPAFQIGKWPVTNAGYACFMDAGGYQTEAYWQTDLARCWLAGEEVTGGQFQTWLNVWKWLQSLGDVRQALESSGNYTPQQIDFYEHVAGLTGEELKAELGESLAEKSRTQPAFWRDVQYNTPSQPVVGITWFEARAYCAWLAALTGKPWRLPTEAEWEAAARGLPRRGKSRKYPWGEEWDPVRANTLEGRVMRPSPVGAFAAAGGAGPFKAEDQAGNVWEWTSSLYLPYPYDPVKSEQPEAEGERVLRGGSWDDDRWAARCASRIRLLPRLLRLHFRVSGCSPWL